MLQCIIFLSCRMYIIILAVGNNIHDRLDLAIHVQYGILCHALQTDVSVYM